MIIPRIILLGDTARASAWIGAAKELVRQTYKAGLRNKTYKNASVEIHIENYLPIHSEMRGWSKVFIVAGEIADFLAVVWHPEGIMLTTPYGFPKRTESQLMVDDDGNEYLIGGELIDPPYGTLNSSFLNQVIINRYENNKYLDRFEYVVGLPTKSELISNDKIVSPIIPFPEVNRRLRGSIEEEIDGGNASSPLPFLQYWPLFYTPVDESGSAEYWSGIYQDSSDPKFWIDEPGLNHWINKSHIDESREPLLKRPHCYLPFIDEQAWRAAKSLGLLDYQCKYRQFEITNGLSYRYQSEIDEPETGTWYCHWPQELLYDNDAYEMIFYLTNQYRKDAGLLPLHREIRGFANTARMIVAECQRQETLEHNDDRYRQGYQTIEERMMNSGSNLQTLGENLIIGFTAGFSIAAGREVAEGWKSSPGHYANMLDSRWATTHTAHDIFGGVIGKYSDGEPQFVNGLWAQTFGKRKYWVIAGSVYQDTDAGRVSIFSIDSPIGNFYLYRNDDYCFKGRILNNYPAELEYGHTIGAALVFEDSTLKIKLLFFLTATNTISYYGRSIINEANDAATFTVYDEYPLAENESVVNRTFFNNTGEEGVITHLKRESVCEYLLPLGEYLPADYRSMVALGVTSQSISELQDIVPPTIVYEYELEDGEFELGEVVDGLLATRQYYYDNTWSMGILGAGVFAYESDTFRAKLGDGTKYWHELGYFNFGYKFLKRYKQSCTGGFDFNPYYDEAGVLQYLHYDVDFSCEQQRLAFTPYGDSNSMANFSAEYYVHDVLSFPWGRSMVVKHQSVDNGVPLVMESGAFFIVFLYIDPVKKDIVYAKINLRGQGEAIYGQSTLYAIVNDVEHEIIEFDEVLISETALRKPRIYGMWQVNPMIGPDEETLVNPSFPLTGKMDNETIVFDVFDPAVWFSLDSLNQYYPALYGESNLQIIRWACVNEPGVYTTAAKLKIGEHKCSLGPSFGSAYSCWTGDGKALHSYNANLKIADFEFDGVTCNVAHYKDRFLMQITIDLELEPTMWHIPFTQEYYHWANFDIESELGFAISGHDLRPFGVV